MSGSSNSLSPAPVLLTGATGFIGRRIQQAMLADGHALRILVRPGSKNLRHCHPQSELLTLALDDETGLKQAVSGVKAVIYAAGSVRGSRLEDFLQANVKGVENLLGALLETGGDPPFLLISSLAAMRPGLSDYAYSKWLGEQALSEQGYSHGSIIRPPAVYGPGDVEMAPILKMARRGIAAAPGPKDQRLSLIHADDLAAAAVSWLQAAPACYGQTFSIDDGHMNGYGWREIVAAAGADSFTRLPLPTALLYGLAHCNRLLARISGRPPMLTPGKVRELTQADWLCDNNAFTEASGWKPAIDLAAGIRQTLEK